MEEERGGTRGEISVHSGGGIQPELSELGFSRQELEKVLIPNIQSLPDTLVQSQITDHPDILLKLGH